MSESRDVGCLCCVSGPLSITLYTDRGGYCPGESIGVSAVINNQSDNEIIGLEIHLIQVTVYIASCGEQYSSSMYWYYKWRPGYRADFYSIKITCNFPLCSA